MKDPIDSAIENIVRTQQVSEQAELLILLKDMKLEISQATLSRRLRHLHISKSSGFYTIQRPLSHILKVVSSQSGIIVIHTLPGYANGVAYAIDQWQENVPEILGTVAGDDTVLVVADALSNVSKIEKEIFYYFGV